MGGPSGNGVTVNEEHKTAGHEAAITRLCAKFVEAMEMEFEGRISTQDYISGIRSNVSIAAAKGDGEVMIDVLAWEYNMMIMSDDSWADIENRERRFLANDKARKELARKWARKLYEDNRELVAEAFLEMSQ
jgi:hypothetical protein